MKNKLFIFILVSSFLFANVNAFAEAVKVPVSSVKDAKAPDSVLQQKNELERLVKTVKLKLEIPQELDTFTSSYNDYTGRKTWFFRWSNDSYNFAGNDFKYIEVNIDATGNIFNYSSNMYSSYGSSNVFIRRLPKVTPQKAEELAKRFIFLLRPDLYSDLSFEKGSKNYVVEIDGNYRFTFNRVYKSIPYYGNSVNIMVNGEDGSIMNFNCNWSDNITFPDTTKVIGLEAAKSAYKKNIGVNLTCRKRYGTEESGTYLVYAPKLAEEVQCIDALTGAAAADNTNENLYYRYDNISQGSYGAMNNNDKIQLTLEDVKALDGIVSLDAAEKYVRSAPEFGVEKSFTLVDCSYFKYKTTGEYSIMLNFTKPLTKADIKEPIPDEKLKVLIASGEYRSTINIEINAKSKGLLGFQTVNMNGNNSTPVKDKEKYLKDVEKFLKKYKADISHQLQPVVSVKSSSEYTKEKYSYGLGESAIKFVRNIKGVPFADNWVGVEIDPVSGKLVAYTQVWDNIDTISNEDIISSDKAYDIFYKDIGLELKFISIPDQGYVSKEGNRSPKLKLVYAPDNSKPACIDARSGNIVHLSSGYPFKENGKTLFKDIDGLPIKDKIMEMENAGLLFEGDTFKADEKLLQKELIYLLLNMRGQYYNTRSRSGFGQQETDNLYRLAINSRIIKEDEKSPDKKVTREDFVKYVLKCCGYNNIGDLKGIFLCDYEDKADISEENISYASIAKALNLIDGKKFFPKKEVTRAEAVEILYGFLKR